MEIIIFCVVMFVGVVYGYFTVSGSGIAERPYGKTMAAPPAPSARAALRDATRACR